VNCLISRDDGAVHPGAIERVWSAFAVLGTDQLYPGKMFSQSARYVTSCGE
jgi:hypothetical protein